MQYTIKINQKAFTEVAPECDIVDAAIFNFIHNFIGSGECKRLPDENEDWFWVSYQKIIDDNPILGINSKPTIYRRVEKLIDAGILKRHPDNQGMAKTYLGRGKNYKAMVYDKPHTQMIDLSYSDDRPPHTEMIDNHNTTNNSINTNSADKQVDYKQFVDFWNEVNDCNLRVTDKKREMIRARLRSYSDDELKTAIENRSRNAWINGEGKKYKTDWKSFWRNDEKVESYLHQSKEDEVKQSNGVMWGAFGD